LCGEIREYARLWSPYLSVIIPSLACNVTYLILTIYLRSLETLQQCYCQFLIFLLTLFLFALMQLCACVGKNNQKVVKENRQFYIIARQRLSMSASFWLRVCITL